MKYYMESYGCTLNQGETEMVGESLEREGHTRVDSVSEADIAVIGTCVVIDKTEKRMRRRIKELQSNCEELLVVGCLPATDGEDGWLQEHCPGCRTMVPDDIASEVDITRKSEDESEGDLYGNLPIATGCIGKCSYCITKLARGDLKSRDPASIEERFTELISAGKKEIRLTCQDTASYGLDLGEGLPDLLKRLTSHEAEYRLRVGMMNPDTAEPIKEDLIEVMKDEHVYEFIHLPLQSGSDRILEKMNRDYSVQDWLELVEYFRVQFPDLTLSTDVIAGFPGEKEEDHEWTKDVLKEAGPDIVNVTRFSPRPGTPAEQMDNKINSRVKKKRSKELTQLRFEISREINERYVGRVEEVMWLEEGKHDTVKGRMDNYKVVVVDDSKDIIGERLDVRLTAAEDVYLKGEIIENR